MTSRIPDPGGWLPLVRTLGKLTALVLLGFAIVYWKLTHGG